jgi:hypothetical protein
VSKLWAAFDKLVETLAQHNVKPVLIGGMAVQLYGWRRMTEDIDIMLTSVDYNKLRRDNTVNARDKIWLGKRIVDVIPEGGKFPLVQDIRDGDSVFPTVDGFIYTKLIANRAKDQADIVEVLKANDMADAIKQAVLSLIPAGLQKRFLALWEIALQEYQDPDYGKY